MPSIVTRIHKKWLVIAVIMGLNQAVAYELYYYDPPLPKTLEFKTKDDYGDYNYLLPLNNL